MKSRSRLLLEKSIAAMLSAIEIYNKPDFKYREEIFSILCINAWELLFKAKVLNLSGNKLASLYILEHRVLKSGSKSSIKRPKKNRAGNPLSINLHDAWKIITDEYGIKIQGEVISNITALTEIRDNSIHFVNDDLFLSIKIQELGSATLQNYFHLVKNWFGDLLSNYNFFLMPISFFRDFTEASSVSLNRCERKILDYIENSEKECKHSGEVGDYNITLKIDIKFQKGTSKSGIPVSITKDESATKVQINVEEMMDRYPWDYGVLTLRLKNRYSDFIINQKYHTIRGDLEKISKFAYKHYLNIKTKRGMKKTLYNPNIVKEFDKHYTKTIMT